MFLREHQTGRLICAPRCALSVDPLHQPCPPRLRPRLRSILHRPHPWPLVTIQIFSCGQAGNVNGVYHFQQFVTLVQMSHHDTLPFGY